MKRRQRGAVLDGLLAGAFGSGALTLLGQVATNVAGQSLGDGTMVELVGQWGINGILIYMLHQSFQRELGLHKERAEQTKALLDTVISLVPPAAKGKTK